MRQNISRKKIIEEFMKISKENNFPKRTEESIKKKIYLIDLRFKDLVKDIKSSNLPLNSEIEKIIGDLDYMSNIKAIPTFPQANQQEIDEQDFLNEAKKIPPLSQENKQEIDAKEYLEMLNENPYILSLNESGMKKKTHYRKLKKKEKKRKNKTKNKTKRKKR